MEQVEKVTSPVLAEHAAELVDLQFVHDHGQWVLRFFLDKGNGITLDDCAVISDHLGRILDAADLIPQSYSLEVSSPGVYRPLRKAGDFARFIGQRVDVTMYAPIDGRRHFRGNLRGVQGEEIQVEDYSQQVFSLPIAQIAKAHLDPELEI